MLTPTATAAVEKLAYSIAEAASMVDLSRARLYQLIEDGTVPSVKIGRRRLIRREALVALLDRFEAVA